ncbi:MAG: pyridoxal-phosphate dependent enzyme [Chloroflexaceae bacterium]|nr:pyridoxal-phosphate dependent enzyme [Chloroflexaceae bacterium]
MTAVDGADTATTPAIHDTILETIGNTPLVRLHKVARGIRPVVAAKVEYLNPGGSVKDRIGIAMIEDAERRGLLKPGGTIVEPTSGNTGMGLAIAAAIKGYKCIFVMPDKMSEEKIRALRAFGARVVITPTAVEPDDPRSYYSVSKRLAEETPNAMLAGQYWNPANPDAHYRSTGPELWEQTQGRISVFVAGMGTGGTISGTGRYLKEQNPGVKVVGVDPIGSLYTEYFRTGILGPAHGYKVEGVGEDFLPTTMDFGVVDDEYLTEDDIVVVLLPDSGSRYLSKIFDDAWMRENGFLEASTVGDLLASKPHEVIAASHDTSIEAAIRVMKTHSISQLPVMDTNGKLHGIVSESDLLDHLLNGGAMSQTIATLHTHDVATVTPDTPVEDLMNALGRSAAAVVVDADQVSGIVTKIDVIDFLASRGR